jgi:Ca2+-dependent lipid-binding protein
MLFIILGPQLIMGGFSNPYVVLKINGEPVAKTKWISKNLNPRWEETFYLFFDHSIPPSFSIEVWDKNWVFDGTNPYLQF